MLITDIYWERIYLHIKLSGENIADNQYIISTKDNVKSCPLSFDGEREEIIINITNVDRMQMLSNDDWFLMYRKGNADEWKRISASAEVLKKHSQLDKIYWYGEGNYAYIFSVIPCFEEKDRTCFIRSAFMKPNSKPERRQVNNDKAPFKRKLHNFLGNFVGKCLNILYCLLSALTPKKNNRVLLMSENRDMGGNLEALDRRIRERGLDKQFKVSYHFAKALNNKGAKLFLVWFRLAILCSKQDFIFIDDYEPFFEHIKLHKKTKLIQVWHAGVGFKSVGYARFGQEGSCHPYASSHRKYDWAIVGGAALKSVYAEVFGIDEEKCLAYGLMRNEGYTDENKIKAFTEEFFKKYPSLKGKKIILYAPTFRGDGLRNAYYPFDVIKQDKIFDMCGDEYAFLIKMHPFIREKIRIEDKYSSRIFDFSDFPDINSLFYTVDILITDYSSNIYEFAMLSKPIISFAFDKENYELERSLHRTLETDAPGKVCESLDEVIYAVKNEDFEPEKLKRFIDNNFSKTSGNAADKVIDKILLGK